MTRRTGQARQIAPIIPDLAQAPTPREQLAELQRLVIAMRKNQRAYAQSRGSVNLALAKQAESQVDKYLVTLGDTTP